MAGSLLSFAITIRFYSIDNNAYYFLSVLLIAVSIPLQHHNYQFDRPLHSFYQLGRAEDLLFCGPCCIPGNRLNVIILVLVLPLVMLNEHVMQENKLSIFLWLGVACDSLVSCQ